MSTSKPETCCSRSIAPHTKWRCVPREQSSKQLAPSSRTMTANARSSLPRSRWRSLSSRLLQQTRSRRTRSWSAGETSQATGAPAPSRPWKRQQRAHERALANSKMTEATVAAQRAQLDVLGKAAGRPERERRHRCRRSGRQRARAELYECACASRRSCCKTNRSARALRKRGHEHDIDRPVASGVRTRQLQGKSVGLGPGRTTGRHFRRHVTGRKSPWDSFENLARERIDFRAPTTLTTQRETSPRSPSV